MNGGVLYVIAFCPVCETGPVAVRICGGCGEPLALCEECDSLWTTADVSMSPMFVKDPLLPCPYCTTSLWRPPSHWANFAELEQVGWQGFVREVGRSGGDASSVDGEPEPWE